MSETRQCIAQTVNFQTRRAVRITGIPVNYTFDTPPKGYPTTADRKYIETGYADRLAKAVWPLPDGGPGYTLNWDQGFEWDYRVDEGEWEAGDRIPERAAVGELRYFALLRKVAALWCTNHNPPIDADYVMAWLPGGVLGGSIPKADARVVIGDAHQQAPLNVAHEMGHMFKFGDNSTLVPAGQVGWDVLGRSAGLEGFHYIGQYIRVPDLAELMVSPYRGSAPLERWVSQGHYVSAQSPANYTGWKCGRPRSSENPPPETDFLFIQGTLSHDPQRPGALQSSIQLRDSVALDSESSGDVVLRVLDAQGGQLYETHLTEDPAGDTPFAVPVPASPDVSIIELRRADALLDAIVRSPSPPTITLRSPLPGGVYTDTLPIEWSSSDADGDDVAAYVSYSPDGGVSWRALEAQLEGDAIVVDASELPASHDGRVRVAVTDGLNTTTAVIGGFVVGIDHAPTAVIASPVESATVPQGSNVILLVYAYDVEDEEVPADRIHWYSSLDGYLGEGPVLNLWGPATTDQPLSVGEHVLEVVVEDSAGLTTHAYRTITVE